MPRLPHRFGIHAHEVEPIENVGATLQCTAEHLELLQRRDYYPAFPSRDGADRDADTSCELVLRNFAMIRNPFPDVLERLHA